MSRIRMLFLLLVIAAIGAVAIGVSGCGEDEVPPLGTAKPAPAAAYPEAPANTAPRPSGKKVPAGYTKALIGMAPKAASDKIQRDGYGVRIASYNGKRSPVTKDYDPGRITLTVVKDRVATAVAG